MAGMTTDVTNLGETLGRELLPAVRNPAQYIGLEANARRADPAAAEVAVALAFPDTYTIGISHLGSAVLYRQLNDTPGVAADRTYCPQVDAEAVMRRRGIPLFGWESRLPLSRFDLIGFSLPYELCVTNVLTMLDLAGLPLRAADRDGRCPLIVGGDALADSPEPVAPFFDVLIPGDGERPMGELVALLAEAKRDGRPREQLLLDVARGVPSAYVPSLYAPGPGGRPEPTRDDIPAEIDRACLSAFADTPAVTRPLVPVSEGVHERVVIEVMRGCPHGCRFCQAGHTRLPVRWRPVEEVVAAAREALAATGYREISLLSLSTGDYPQLGELIDRLNAEFAGRHVSISLPSLHVDSQLKHLPKLTSEVRKGGLTIAAEAGSERLRRAIGKRITTADMIDGVRAAYQAGWQKVKVYFMAGLPGERQDDIDAIVDLCRQLSDARRDVDGQRGNISASVSWLVPKPHTPMQWNAMQTAEYFFAVKDRLRQLTRKGPVQMKFHHVERSLLEAVLCRGGREIADVIEAVWRDGARLDAWNEHFDHQRWFDALAAADVDVDALIHTERAPGVPLPWSHIGCPRSEDTLARQRERMLQEAGIRH